MSEVMMNSNVWHRINWPGIIAGIVVIALPFLGNWWIFKLGTEAFVFAVSPFGVDLSIFGEMVSVSPLLRWLILGLKLGVVYLGVVLLSGSILSAFNRYAMIAELFVRFSARKLLWLVLAFVIILLVVCVVVNQLPGILGLPFQLPVPYLRGTKSFPVSIGEGVLLTIPVSMDFTRAFIIAAIAVALGIAAWMYQEKTFIKRKER